MPTLFQVEKNIENYASVACDIKNRFFTSDKITELLLFLLNYSLLLSESELNEWSNDGEIFFIVQEGTKERKL